MRLPDYWRSGTSYRVRIALALKRLAYEQITYVLRKAERRDAHDADVNPRLLVPVLEMDDSTVLTHSPAILESLEEAYPASPLMPAERMKHAIVEAMAMLLGYDVHPLDNRRVLSSLWQDPEAGEDRVRTWIARGIMDGSTELEPLIAQHRSGAAFADTPKIADCYLVPQVYSAKRFGVPPGPYPWLVAATEEVSARADVAAALPGRQPAADQP